MKVQFHVANKTVWRSDADGRPRDTGMIVTDFLEHPGMSTGEQIRLLGTRENAELITGLFDLKAKGQIKSVQVCSPRATVEQSEDPAIALTPMRVVNLPASVGGFHELEEKDRRAYSLTDAIEKNARGQSTEGKERILRELTAHPAWPAIGFFSHIDRISCASILGLMCDPRWHMDPHDPDSASDLYRAFGLDLNTQRELSFGDPRSRANRPRHIVLNAWKNPALVTNVRRTFELTTPLPVAGIDRPGSAPGDFPWRVWGKALQIGLREHERITPDETIADLMASQRLLRFMREVWLNEIYRGSPSVPENGAALFRPADFFEHPTEVAAYEQHQLQCGMS